MHIPILICSLYGCIIHHILCCFKKLSNYINYSIMKWYIVVLFKCNVCHLSIPYSMHRSITSKSCNSYITQSMVKYSRPNFIQNKIKLCDWSRSLDIKGSLLHFTPFYRLIYFSIILLLYQVCNFLKHNHWVLPLLHIQLNLCFVLEMIDHCIPYIFINKKDISYEHGPPIYWNYNIWV